MAGNWQSLLMERLGQDGGAPSDLPNLKAGQETLAPASFAAPVDKLSSSASSAPEDIPAEQHMTKLEPEPNAEALQIKPDASLKPPVAPGHSTEDVMPGIFDKNRHLPEPQLAKNTPWWGKKVDPSPKNGNWVPSTVSQRRRRKLNLVESPEPRRYDIVDDKPHRLEDPIAEVPEVQQQPEKEAKLKLVERVWFDETGKQLDVHEYEGLAQEFTNFARNILDRVKGKDPHKQNLEQAAESMKKAHIVWDNNEKQKILDAQLTTEGKGSSMESSEQTPNELDRIDQAVSAELGADASLEGVGDPLPPASESGQMGQIEVTDVTPAAEAGHGPSFQESSVDEVNPLSPDPALEALQHAVASPRDEALGNEGQAVSMSAPEVQGSRVVAAEAPELPVDVANGLPQEPLTASQPQAEHFAASFPRPELKLVGEDETPGSENQPGQAKQVEQVSAAPEIEIKAVETPGASADNIPRESGFNPDLVAGEVGQTGADSEPVVTETIAPDAAIGSAGSEPAQPKRSLLQRMFGITPKVDDHMTIGRAGQDINAADVARFENNSKDIAA